MSNCSTANILCKKLTKWSNCGHSYKKNFRSNVLGIFVNPVTGDEVTFKQTRLPLLHLGLTFTTQSALFFLQQIFLVRCGCLIRVHNGVAHCKPQSEMHGLIRVNYWYLIGIRIITKIVSCWLQWRKHPIADNRDVFQLISKIIKN